MVLTLDSECHKGGVMSKKKKLTIKVLHIDDNVVLYDSLKGGAEDYGIDLEHAIALKTGMKMLTEKGNQYYDGIIVDACGKINEDDSIDRVGHITEAYKELNQLNLGLPIVIFTGESKRYSPLTIEELCSSWDVFQKGNPEVRKKMFELLVEKSKHKKDNIIARQNSDVFEVFDKGYLDLNTKKKLLDCIKRMNSNDNLEIIKTIHLLRHLIEAICKAINKVDNRMVPNDFFPVRKPGKEPEVDFRGIQWHLRGRRNKETKKDEGTIYVPYDSIEDRFIDLIYTVVSDYGSHDNVKQVPGYVLPILTYAMLNHLLWFKGIYQERTERA